MFFRYIYIYSSKRYLYIFGTNDCQTFSNVWNVSVFSHFKVGQTGIGHNLTYKQGLMNYSEKKTSDFSHHFTPKRKYMHIPKTFNPGLSKRTFNESLEKKIREIHVGKILKPLRISLRISLWFFECDLRVWMCDGYWIYRYHEQRLHLKGVIISTKGHQLVTLGNQPSPYITSKILSVGLI